MVAPRSLKRPRSLRRIDGGDESVVASVVWLGHRHRAFVGWVYLVSSSTTRTATYVLVELWTRGELLPNGGTFLGRARAGHGLRR